MPKTGMGLQAYVGFYNFVWLFVFISVLYGVGSCILGQTARLPGVADAAEQQIFSRGLRGRGGRTVVWGRRAGGADG